MQPEKFKSICIRAIKPMLHVAEQRCIIHNDSNTRIWWKEGEKTYCIVLVNDMPESLLSFAELLTECRLIDFYEPIQRNGKTIDVLLCKGPKKLNHGMQYYLTSEIRETRLSELRLTAVDVLDIASTVVYKRCIAGEQKVRIVELYPGNNPDCKQTA